MTKFVAISVSLCCDYISFVMVMLSMSSLPHTKLKIVTLILC